jgi:hypothetical protein
MRETWLAVMRRALPICAAALAAGCVSEPPANPCDGGTCPAERTVKQVFQSAENRMLDLLFVVDDTAGIAPFRDMLAGGFAANARVLEGLVGGVPELHVGFISSSLCGGAPATRAQACGVAAPSAYATVDTCGQHVNVSGSLENTFSCLGDFGVSSCATAQPLAALRRLLESPPRGWEGFLRPGATLAIVIVAGEDDASPDDVAGTVAFVRSLKSDPANTILLSAIVPPSTDCAAVPVIASRPPRLSAFVASAGANGLTDSFCDGGLGYALVTLATTLASDTLSPCLPGVRDDDPAAPGMQARCTVEETIESADGAQTTTLLPSCDQAAPPCWSLQPPAGFDLLTCAGGWTFQVTRPGGYCPALFTRTTIECLGCLDPADPACAPASP